jgi:crossover junction endodeoxyribonuclease RuvC
MVIEKNQNPAELVLGIDPGISETGWALISGSTGAAPQLIDSGLIKTFPRQPLPERLKFIHNALAVIFNKHSPHSAAVEEMFFLKAAYTIRNTLQARGVVLLAAAQAGLPISEYNPRSVKIALSGNGSAQKPQMQKAVQKSLGLAEVLSPDDVADAAAIAICHLRAGRMKKLTVLASIGGSKGVAR